MTATTIRVQMAQRKDTAAGWTAANPVLLLGEIGYETDAKKFKIGDGTTNWNSLAYLPIPDGSGDLTITGNLEIGNTGTLTFEGSTADDFETTLAITDPTADRTITLPDVTGTVVTTGDLGTVTSAMIENGAIVDADVNASAAIAGTKISPNFGSQAVVTTDTSTAASFIPTSNTAPTNGLYLPAANNVAISSSGTQRVNFGTGAVVFNETGENYDFRIEGDTNANIFFVDASANAVGIGTTSPQELLELSSSSATRLLIRSTTETVSASSQLHFLTGTGASADTNRIASVYGIISQAAPSQLKGELAFRVNKGDSESEVARLDSSGTFRVKGAGTAGTTDAVQLNGSAPANSLLLDASGRLLVGTSGARASFQRPNINCEGLADAGITICRNNANNSPPVLEFGKTRSTSIGGNTAVINNDYLGMIRFYGANGTDLSNEGARISAEVDGDPFTSGDTTDLPTRLVFSTTPDGDSSPDPRMTIKADGKVGIGTETPGASLHVAGTGAVIRVSDGERIDLIPGANANDPSLIVSSTGSALTFASNGASAMASLDTSGRLLVGTTTSASSWSATTLEVIGNTTNSGNLVIGRNDTSIIAGNSIGRVSFWGNDSSGTTYEECARIEAEADGTHGDGDKPTRLVFSTNGGSPDTSPTPRMTIKSNGATCIGTTTEGGMSGDTVVAIGPNLGIISKSATAAASTGTVDIVIRTDGGGYQGFLIVCNTRIGSSNVRTHSTYSVFGRGTDSSIQEIATDNGSTSGASFTVTTPSNGLIRVTNTLAFETTVSIQFFGGTSP